MKCSGWIERDRRSKVHLCFFSLKTSDVCGRPILHSGSVKLWWTAPRPPTHLINHHAHLRPSINGSGHARASPVLDDPFSARQKGFRTGL